MHFPILVFVGLSHLFHLEISSRGRKICFKYLLNSIDMNLMNRLQCYVIACAAIVFTIFVHFHNEHHPIKCDDRKSRIKCYEQ